MEPSGKDSSTISRVQQDIKHFKEQYLHSLGISLVRPESASLASQSRRESLSNTSDQRESQSNSGSRRESLSNAGSRRESLSNIRTRRDSLSSMSSQEDSSFLPPFATHDDNTSYVFPKNETLSGCSVRYMGFSKLRVNSVDMPPSLPALGTTEALAADSDISDRERLKLEYIKSLGLSYRPQKPKGQLSLKDRVSDFESLVAKSASSNKPGFYYTSSRTSGQERVVQKLSKTLPLYAHSLPEPTLKVFHSVDTKIAPVFNKDHDPNGDHKPSLWSREAHSASRVPEPRASVISTEHRSFQNSAPNFANNSSFSVFESSASDSVKLPLQSSSHTDKPLSAIEIPNKRAKLKRAMSLDSRRDVFEKSTLNIGSSSNSEKYHHVDFTTEPYAIQQRRIDFTAEHHTMEHKRPDFSTEPHIIQHKCLDYSVEQHTIQKTYTEKEKSFILESFRQSGCRQRPYFSLTSSRNLQAEQCSDTFKPKPSRGPNITSQSVINIVNRFESTNQCGFKNKTRSVDSTAITFIRKNSQRKQDLVQTESDESELTAGKAAVFQDKIASLFQTHGPNTNDTSAELSRLDTFLLEKSRIVSETLGEQMSGTDFIIDQNTQNTGRLDKNVAFGEVNKGKIIEPCKGNNFHNSSQTENYEHKHEDDRFVNCMPHSEDLRVGISAMYEAGICGDNADSSEFKYTSRVHGLEFQDEDSIRPGSRLCCVDSINDPNFSNLVHELRDFAEFETSFTSSETSLLKSDFDFPSSGTESQPLHITVGETPQSHRVIEKTTTDYDIIKDTPIFQSMIVKIPQSHSIIKEIPPFHCIMEKILLSDDIMDEIPPSYSIMEEIPPSHSIMEEIPLYHRIVEEIPSSHGIMEEITPFYGIIEEIPLSHCIIEEIPPSHSIMEESSPIYSIIEIPLSHGMIEEIPPSHSIMEKIPPSPSIMEEISPSYGIIEEIPLPHSIIQEIPSCSMIIPKSKLHYKSMIDNTPQLQSVISHTTKGNSFYFTSEDSDVDKVHESDSSHVAPDEVCKPDITSDGSHIVPDEVHESDITSDSSHVMPDKGRIESSFLISESQALRTASVPVNKEWIINTESLLCVNANDISDSSTHQREVSIVSGIESDLSYGPCTKDSAFNYFQFPSCETQTLKTDLKLEISLQRATNDAPEFYNPDYISEAAVRKLETSKSDIIGEKEPSLEQKNFPCLSDKMCASLYETLQGAFRTISPFQGIHEHIPECQFETINEGIKTKHEYPTDIRTSTDFRHLQEEFNLTEVVNRLSDSSFSLGAEYTCLHLSCGLPACTGNIGENLSHVLALGASPDEGNRNLSVNSNNTRDKQSPEVERILAQIVDDEQAWVCIQNHTTKRNREVAIKSTTDEESTVYGKFEEMVELENNAIKNIGEDMDADCYSKEWNEIVAITGGDESCSDVTQSPENISSVSQWNLEEVFTDRISDGVYIGHTSKEVYREHISEKDYIQRTLEEVFTERTLKEAQIESTPGKESAGLRSNNVPIEHLSERIFIDGAPKEDTFGQSSKEVCTELSEKFSIQHPLDEISIEHPSGKVSIQHLLEVIATEHETQEVSTEQPLEKISVEHPLKYSNTSHLQLLPHTTIDQTVSHLEPSFHSIIDSNVSHLQPSTQTIKNTNELKLQPLLQIPVHTDIFQLTPPDSSLENPSGHEFPDSVKSMLGISLHSLFNEDNILEMQKKITDTSDLEPLIVPAFNSENDTVIPELDETFGECILLEEQYLTPLDQLPENFQNNSSVHYTILSPEYIQSDVILCNDSFSNMHETSLFYMKDSYSDISESVDSFYSGISDMAESFHSLDNDHDNVEDENKEHLEAISILANSDLIQTLSEEDTEEHFAQGEMDEPDMQIQVKTGKKERSHDEEREKVVYEAYSSDIGSVVASRFEELDLELFFNEENHGDWYDSGECSVRSNALAGGSNIPTYSTAIDVQSSMGSSALELTIKQYENIRGKRGCDEWSAESSTQASLTLRKGLDTSPNNESKYEEGVSEFNDFDMNRDHKDDLSKGKLHDFSSCQNTTDLTFKEINPLCLSRNKNMTVEDAVPVCLSEKKTLIHEEMESACISGENTFTLEDMEPVCISREKHLTLEDMKLDNVSEKKTWTLEEGLTEEITIAREQNKKVVIPTECNSGMPPILKDQIQKLYHTESDQIRTITHDNSESSYPSAHHHEGKDAGKIHDAQLKVKFVIEDGLLNLNEKKNKRHTLEPNRSTTVTFEEKYFEDKADTVTSRIPSTHVYFDCNSNLSYHFINDSRLPFSNIEYSGSDFRAERAEDFNITPKLCNRDQNNTVICSNGGYPRIAGPSSPSEVGAEEKNAHEPHDERYDSNTESCDDDSPESMDRDSLEEDVDEHKDILKHSGRTTAATATLATSSNSQQTSPPIFPHSEESQNESPPLCSLSLIAKSESEPANPASSFTSLSLDHIFPATAAQPMTFVHLEDPITVDDVESSFKIKEKRFKEAEDAASANVSPSVTSPRKANVPFHLDLASTEVMEIGAVGAEESGESPGAGVHRIPSAGVLKPGQTDGSRLDPYRMLERSQSDASLLKRELSAMAADDDVHLSKAEATSGQKISECNRVYLDLSRAEVFERVELGETAGVMMRTSSGRLLETIPQDEELKTGDLSYVYASHRSFSQDSSSSLEDLTFSPKSKTKDGSKYKSIGKSGQDTLTSSKSNLRSSFQIYSHSLKQKVRQLQMGSVPEQVNALNELNVLMEQAWSMPVYGKDLAYELCDILRTESALDIIVSNLASSNRELMKVSARLLEQSLTTSNRRQIAENGLELVVKMTHDARGDCELAQICTGILESLFKTSEDTCAKVIKLGGLDTITYWCRCNDRVTLKNCAIALSNLALYGGGENQQEMAKHKVPEWLFPLAFVEDDSVRYYALLAIGVLVSNKEIENAVISSGTLSLVLPFIERHDPAEFAERDMSHRHGRSPGWLKRLIPVLSSKREEAQALAAFHFVMEAGIKSEQGRKEVLYKIGAVDPLKWLASTPNRVASRLAVQALKIIGEEIPHKLSQQVPLWTCDDVVHWIAQVGFGCYAEKFSSCCVDGDLLLRLTEEELKDSMNMPCAITRKRFLRELRDLKISSDYTSCDPSMLGAWLQDVGEDMSQYTYQMLYQGVDRQLLRSLTDMHLVNDCKITNGIHRMKILSKIEELRSIMTSPSCPRYDSIEIMSSAHNLSKTPIDVFISYRRSNGSQLASLLKVHLQLRGFTVFIDIEKLRAGKFDESLLESVRQAKNFIIVLTQNSLDRCMGDEDRKDWVHREITAALEAGSNIIPLLDNFKWPVPDSLPEDMRNICYFNAVRWIHDYQDACVDKLEQFLRGENNPQQRHPVSTASTASSGNTGPATPSPKQNSGFESPNSPPYQRAQGMKKMSSVESPVDSS